MMRPWGKKYLLQGLREPPQSAARDYPPVLGGVESVLGGTPLEFSLDRGPLMTGPIRFSSAETTCFLRREPVVLLLFPAVALLRPPIVLRLGHAFPSLYVWPPPPREITSEPQS